MKPLKSILISSKGKDLATYTINNQAMFVRLIAIAERVDSLESVFTFELTPQPMSLFKNGLMRKPDKPSLLKAVISKTSQTQIPTYEFEMCTATVVDGGALLHRVRWLKGRDGR